MNRDEPCLVIMPFGKTPSERLISSLVYENIIRSAFREVDIKETRIDSEVLLNRSINAEMEKRLQTTPLVLADVSGNNPNVLFELGFRRAHGKPFVCISSRPEDAGFYPRHFQIIDYTLENAVTRIANAIRAAFSGLHFPVHLSVQDEINLLTSAVQPDHFMNPFQDRVAAWRIRRAFEQVEEIHKRQWEFEAKTGTAYVAYIFQGILDLLSEGEEYCTVTNLKFWSDRAVGESAFLRANMEAAKRGVIIKRVFLIDKNDIYLRQSNRGLEALIESHRNACREVEIVKPGNMILKCLPSEDINKDIERYGHFGLARDSTGAIGTERGCMVIVPRYEASTGAISHLRVTFSSGTSVADFKTREYVQKFEWAFSEAENFDSVLSHYTIKPKL